MTEAPEKELARWQSRHFELLEEFWQAATGIGPGDLPIPAFDNWVRQNARNVAGRAPFESDSFEQLVTFYEQIRHESVFEKGRGLGGLKLVLGGGSRLTQTHLASIRKMALYADTIFVPDPVLPWIESPRDEEAFPFVWLLQSVFHLLSLKALVNLELPYPPIVVFPSWEKSLEARDSTTRDGQMNLVTAVVADALGRPFEGYADLVSYAKNDSEEFLRLVDEKQLLIAPGDGKIGDPLERSIQLYREEIQTWRSEDYKKETASFSDAQLVLNGLSERIGPQYHVLENAEELLAGPMFALDIHWYYYKKCASLFETQLKKLALLDEETAAEVRALETPRFDWLGDVPIELLAELRSNGENEAFRNAVRRFTSQLHDASLEDLNRVAGQVSRGISSLVTDHKKEIRRIQEKYKPGKIRSLLAAGVTGAATYFPALAPFAPASGVALLAQFAWDRIAEEMERSNASRSLMGVLAQGSEDV